VCSVQDGKFYMVGEKGPELFAPGMNGWIIPNDQTRQMLKSDQPNSRGVTQMVHFHIQTPTVRIAPET